MGIRFNCPNGHKLNVKEFLAGKRGVCPECGAKFIIPVPTDAPAAEAPLRVGIGQSQSVEIAVLPSPNAPAVSAAASPSVIIPVTDLELAPAEVEVRPAIPRPDLLPPAALPSSIVAVPAGGIPEAVASSPRERSRRNQMLISLLLLALVVLLAAVLIWVLKRNATSAPVEKAKAASRAELPSAVAMVDGGFLFRAQSRLGAAT